MIPRLPLSYVMLLAVINPAFSENSGFLLFVDVNLCLRLLGLRKLGVGHTKCLGFSYFVDEA